MNIIVKRRPVVKLFLVLFFDFFSSSINILMGIAPKNKHEKQQDLVFLNNKKIQTK